MVDESNFHIDCPHWSNLACQDYSEKTIDILWFKNKQSQLETPDNVKLEELERDIIHELEHKNKETPRAKQHKQVFKTKLKPNKKLDCKVDDDDEISEILKRHNKKIESKMGLKKGGKEIYLAASTANVNPPITAKHVGPNTTNLTSSCSRKLFFENADSGKPINKRISMHGVRRVISPKSAIIIPNQNPSPEDPAPKMTMPRKRVSISVSKSHPDFIKRLGCKDAKLDVKLDELDQDNNENTLLEIEPGDVVKQVYGVAQDTSKKRVSLIKEVKPVLMAKESGSKCIVKSKETVLTFKATATKTKAHPVKGTCPVIRPSSKCIATKTNNVKALVTKTKAITICSKRQISSVDLSAKCSRDTTVNCTSNLPSNMDIKSSTSLKSVRKHPSRATELTAAKVARRPSTAPTTKRALSEPFKKKIKPISAPLKIDDEVLKYLDPGFTMKPIKSVSSTASAKNVPTTSSKTYSNKQKSVVNEKQGGRLSNEKEPKNLLFKTHHSRYSVDTPSPLHNDTSRKVNSDSDSDIDDYIYQKLKAHNKRIEEQSIKANGIPESSQRCEPMVKQPRKVSLHLGSPSKPKMRVRR